MKDENSDHGTPADEDRTCVYCAEVALTGTDPPEQVESLEVV
jgi:hypothetical protein